MSRNKPKAYSYIRFSTPEQARGDSYRRQREAAEKFCLENDLEFVSSKEYLFFDKGKSAFHGRNVDDAGELARFLGYVNDGHILPGSYLIVESLDRLSRERVREALPRFLELINRGIRIYTSADRMLYTEKSDERDILISVMVMSRAHGESSLKGQRVSAAWKAKQKRARERGLPLGRACPYWLSLENGKYTFIESRVDVVRKVFNLSISGHGQRAIAKILNQDGVPVFGSAARNKSGFWGASSVSKLLSNRALLGEYQPTNLIDGVRTKAGEPISDFFPRVLSEETFYQAQNTRVVRKAYGSTKNSKEFNIWQGIAKCGLCGGAMHLVNKGGNLKYLRCYNSAKGVCQARSLRLDITEVAYREVLAKVDSLSLVQDAHAKIKKDLDVADAKYVQLIERQGKLMSQAANVDIDLPDLFVQMLSELQQEVDICSKLREKLRSDLQKDRIINKSEFFSRLDLVSQEGRAKSNYLLKSLDILVSLRAFESAHIFCVYVEGYRSFSIVLNDGDALFYPYTRGALDSIRTQGDESEVSLLGEKEIKESELRLVKSAADRIKDLMVSETSSNGLTRLRKRPL
ncbi:recombinase family protein [Pseudomonas aeruginosa]|nr:recombinase family protein [Pseudomonas aeruginosa]MDV6936126.1 recombinase family protein [Pseudomonas aeruginosa]MDV6959523.1 recombinase family protein [Pseudomonas aeruginosa]